MNHIYYESRYLEYMDGAMHYDWWKWEESAEVVERACSRVYYVKMKK